MAPQSIQLDRQAGDWPLGLIVVPTPGLPIGIMSLVDPNSYNDPNSPTSISSGEYTVVAQQIQIQGMKSGGVVGLSPNLGNIYVCRKGVQGAGNRYDYGSIVAIIFPGQTLSIAAAPMNMDVLNPYRYFIDADNANDSALVTLFIG